MILFLLLRRLRPQTRIVVGSVITAAGLVLVAVAAAVAVGLLIHGAALAVIGAVMWISGLVSKRRAQAASERQASAQQASEMSAAGHGNDR